ncbi:hypothetical protein [Haladaptatus pallidirubidus]
MAYIKHATICGVLNGFDGEENRHGFVRVSTSPAHDWRLAVGTRRNE